jgi:hypothetical protein
MKRKINSVTHLITMINRHGQLSTKNIFFYKTIKKFYRFTILELF